jgi:hypothetical protein
MWHDGFERGKSTAPLSVIVRKRQKSRFDFLSSASCMCVHDDLDTLEALELFKSIPAAQAVTGDGMMPNNSPMRTGTHEDNSQKHVIIYRVS